MDLFSKVGNFWFDFLFPKKREVVKLESLSSENLLRVLPPAQIEEGNDLIAIFDYQDELVREMIWELKYGGNKKIAERIGEVLYDVITDELSLRDISGENSAVIMPIPVSDKRRSERGWNQCELLAEAVKKCDSGSSYKYLPRQLSKFRHTESQTRTSGKHEREENVKGSMRVLNHEKVKGRCIILIDDVSTTGATFKEAKRALKEAGAKKILCVAVAH